MWLKWKVWSKEVTKPFVSLVNTSKLFTVSEAILVGGANSEYMGF